MVKEGNLDILTWCFFDRSRRGDDVVKLGDWYQHLLSRRGKRGITITRRTGRE